VSSQRVLHLSHTHILAVKKTTRTSVDRSVESADMDTGYLTTQVTTIIGQLHSIFDEIGVPRSERESRETELFAALSETLHNQLRLVNT